MIESQRGPDVLDWNPVAAVARTSLSGMNFAESHRK